METRALIAFVLSIAILVGYQLLLAQHRPATGDAPVALTDDGWSADGLGPGPGRRDGDGRAEGERACIS